MPKRRKETQKKLPKPPKDPAIIPESLEAMAALVQQLGVEIQHGYRLESQIQDFVETLEEQRATLRDKITRILEEQGLADGEASAGVFQIRLKKRRVDVKITDQGHLPPEYISDGSGHPNLLKIRRALESGKTVPGAELVPRKRILVIS